MNRQKYPAFSRGLGWLSLAIFAVALSPYFLPILSHEAFLEYTDVWIDVPLLGLIAVLCLVRRRDQEPYRTRLYWNAWGLGFGIWFLGRVSWGLLFDLGLPIDLAADFMFQLFYVGALVALETNPAARPPTDFHKKLRRYTLTGGVILLMTGYVYFALIPGLANPETYESWKPSVIGALVFDFYVATRLLFRRRSSKGSSWEATYRWFALAFCWWVVTDALDVVWLYRSWPLLDGGSLFDLAWYVPYGLVVAGVIEGRRGQQASPEVREHQEPTVAAGPLGGTLLVSYAFSLLFIHTALEWGGLLDPALNTLRAGLLAVESVIMAGLIIISYRLILRENRRLRDHQREMARKLEQANVDLERRVKERTADLEKAHGRNRALIQAVPDTLILLDHEHRILEVFTGSEGADLLDLKNRTGADFRDVVPANSRDILVDTLDLLKDVPNLPPVPILIEGPEGSHYLEMRFGPCGLEETLVLWQDVTDRRKMEWSLQQSQKLESLGVLAGGVAHDFNNLLTSILGNAQLAREQADPGGENVRLLGIIESSALRAAKLTGNLLAYAGEAHIELSPFNLTGLIRDMEPLWKTGVSGKVQYQVSLPAQPLWIMGNESQVSQIILNLVRNAAESIEKQPGEIQLSLENVQLGNQALPNQVLSDHPQPGSYVRLTVKDNGCGLGLKDQQRIFDPFYTSKGSGRGLGLAAVLGIISHHGGLLTLKSGLGSGSEFSVYLPAAEALASAQESFSREAGTTLAGRVLVVDDDQDVRGFVCRCLQRMGLATREAADGIQAVDAVREIGPDLMAVIMDYSMPRMDGAQAHGIIRQAYPRLPVVMMSGYGEGEILGGLAGDGDTVFLQKPFEMDKLRATLERVLGQEARQAEA